MLMFGNHGNWCPDISRPISDGNCNLCKFGKDCGHFSNRPQIGRYNQKFKANLYNSVLFHFYSPLLWPFPPIFNPWSLCPSLFASLPPCPFLFILLLSQAPSQRELWPKRQKPSLSVNGRSSLWSTLPHISSYHSIMFTSYVFPSDILQENQNENKTVGYNNV